MGREDSRGGGLCYGKQKWKARIRNVQKLTPQRLHLHQLEQETPAQHGQSLQLAILCDLCMYV